jgi:hypothetical protein
MSKRLITATLAFGLAVLATPALARPNDDDDSPRARHRTYEGERRVRGTDADRDDGDRVTRRTQRRQAGKRHGRGQSARRARRTSLASRSMTRNVGGTGTSRSCLTGPARALLERIETTFGRVQIVSTCRPGARIAGSGRPSKHGSGQAIDFNAPSGRKAELVRWLIANHRSGGTMTYSGMSHIHVDVGQRFVSLNAGGGR